MNMIWTKFQSTNNHFVFHCYSEERFLTSLFNDNIPKYITSVFRRELKMEVTFAKAVAIFVNLHCTPPFSRSFTLPECLFVRGVLETLSHTYYPLTKAASKQEREWFIKISVSLDQNLDYYNKAISDAQIHLPEADEKLKKIEYTLREVIGQTKYNILDHIKKQSVFTAETEKSGEKQTSASEKGPNFPEATLHQVDLTSFMTPVRNQGQLGSTVGFSVAAALEYQIKKKAQRGDNYQPSIHILLCQSRRQFRSSFR